VLLLLFLGALETFRLMSLQQSLRTGLMEAVPCYNHWRDKAYRTQCYPEGWLQARMRANPVAMGSVSTRIEAPPDLDVLPYGAVFEIAATADVRLGVLYPFQGGPTIRLRASTVTFIDAAPEYYQLWWETPMPWDPGPLRR
jgi:hypothetical protein